MTSQPRQPGPEPLAVVVTIYPDRDLTEDEMSKVHWAAIDALPRRVQVNVSSVRLFNEPDWTIPG